MGTNPFCNDRKAKVSMLQQSVIFARITADANDKMMISHRFRAVTNQIYC